MKYKATVSKIYEYVKAVVLRVVFKFRKPKDKQLDSQEFCQLLKISKRTAQMYLNHGRIPFSQMGDKVYYRQSDLPQLMGQHSKRSSKNKP